MKRVPLSRFARLCRLLLLAVIIVMPAVAFADFRICNRTNSRVGVAVGYKDNDGWSTEGWWNVLPGGCELLLPGPLVARFYYIYAVDYDQGGEWSGKAFMCTRDRMFVIHGVGDCLARGYNRTGFFEVDTGEQRNWTIQLTEQGQAPSAAPPVTQTRPGTQSK